MSRVYYGLDVEQGKKAFMGASEFVLSDKNILSRLNLFDHVKFGSPSTTTRG